MRVESTVRVGLGHAEVLQHVKELSAFDIEQHDGVAWKVFYVVAPDGLCYWFGERQTS